MQPQPISLPLFTRRHRVGKRVIQPCTEARYSSCHEHRHPHTCSKPALTSASHCAFSVSSSGTNSIPSSEVILSFFSSKHGWVVDPSGQLVGSGADG
mmetsp:Transcript_59033/g.155293  ORF Transcript_59033/g.155293 Transcript_59033/m.155293 type:complete len:97 (+) Transcript_59033:107-397(+)